MHVLFLEIDTESSWAVASLGPAFLAGYLRRHGHEASLLRVRLGMPMDELLAAVRQHKPDLIGVSLTTRQWQEARRILNELRQHLDIPVVAGGLHPTFSPCDTLGQPGIDYVCMGEGEKPTLALIQALETGSSVSDGHIKGIWAKGGVKPPLDQPFEPIDDLPYMARDMLDERYGVVHMTTQRGCPFPCTYCAARMYDDLYAAADTQYGRRRSHAGVLDELFTIRRNGDLNYVIFLDDTFTIHHPWVFEFCNVYGREFKTPFSLHARVETVNQKMLHALARAGCRHITYGVESGSNRVRRQIMNRLASNEKFIQVFRWTRQEGIIVTANYMMGMPGETLDEMRQTLDLHEQLQPDDFGYFVFYPYPGTYMFKVCQEKGYLPEDYLGLPADHRRSILNLPGVSQDDIAAMYSRWTQARVAHAVKRQGPGCSDENRRRTVEMIEHCAATG